MDRENIAPIPKAGMTEENTKKKKVKEVLEYAESLTVVFAVMLLIFTFIARPATVDGESMLPTLCNGERLVISNLFYEPAPGDIVVLCGEADREEGRNLIKRIIAVGGQTIDIDFETGEVSVDGTVLQEDYINALTTVDGGVHFPLTVAEGCIFVLGDNRGISKDSRYPDVGQIDKREVLGKAIFLMYPGTDDGTYPREFDRVGAIQ